MAEKVYILLVILGCALLMAEFFVPGGVLAMVGFAALFVGGVLGFVAFGPFWGTISLGFILAGGVAFMLWWGRLFSTTKAGKLFTLETSTVGKASTDHDEWVGMEGEALTDLRPGGMVSLNHQRIDVLAEGGWVDKGQAVVVTRVEGNRIFVRKQEIKEHGE